MAGEYPRYILWSTDNINLEDRFQRTWLLCQILLHGLAKDIRRLDFNEVYQDLDNLRLPSDIDNLWRTYLENRNEISQHYPG